MKKEIMFVAYNDKKEIVDIKSVPNGVACNCTCIACGQPLNARNEGKHNIPHFAHVSGFDNPACSETAKHAMAKQIIQEIGWFPFGNKAYKDDSLELEKTIGDIRPDVLAVYNGNPYAIEFYVKHKIDEEKLSKIINNDLSLVEIDLSKAEICSKEDLIKNIFESNNIKNIMLSNSLRIGNKKKILHLYGVKIPIQDNAVQCLVKVNDKYGNHTFLISKDYCRNCTFCCDDNEPGFIRCGFLLWDNSFFDFQVFCNSNVIKNIEETKRILSTFLISLQRESMDFRKRKRKAIPKTGQINYYKYGKPRRRFFTC